MNCKTEQRETFTVRQSRPDYTNVATGNGNSS